MAGTSVIESLRINSDWKIIGTDTNSAANLKQSKAVDTFYKVPQAIDDGYIDVISGITEREKIDYIIPLIDYEIDRFNEHRKTFAKLNAVVTISNTLAVNIIRDKLFLHNYFRPFSEINVIPTFIPDELKNTDFPLVAKIRKGRSSEGLRFIENNEQKGSISGPGRYVFQPKIEGSIHTVDVVRDTFGNVVSMARKEIVRSENGAGLQVEFTADKKLDFMVQFITSKLDITGCINIEFIYDGNTYHLMDINPRFSAGVSFSLRAGYDFIGNHLRCFMNVPIEKMTKIFPERLPNMILNETER